MRGTFRFDPKSISAKDAFLPADSRNEKDNRLEFLNTRKELLELKIQELEEQTESVELSDEQKKIIQQNIVSYEKELDSIVEESESIIDGEQFRVPKRSLFTEPEPSTPFVKKLRPDILKPEQKMLKVWTRELNDIMQRALQPLVTVVGMVAATLTLDDSRILFAWKENASTMNDRLKIVQYADTVEDFIIKNQILGSTLLRGYISTYKPKDEEESEIVDMQGQIKDDCFNLDLSNPDMLSSFILGRSKNMNSAAQRALQYLARSEVEAQFAPAWAFEAMSGSVFRAILSTTCFGAFTAAADQIRRNINCRSFTIKELICSPDVRRSYAYIIASQYLLSGGAINRDGNKGGGRTRNSTYQNINVMRRQEAESVHNGLIWFESVYASINPLLLSFESEKSKKLSSFQMNTDQIVQYRVNQFKKDPTWERADDLTTLLGDNTDTIQRWNYNMNTFLQIWLDDNSSELAKKNALTTASNQYFSLWQFLVTKNSLDFVNQQVEKIREEMSANMDKFKQMLPKRVLKYQG